MHTMELILDNGTIHAPKQLERWLQHLPVVLEGKLTFHVVWLPTKVSWLDQIEIWFSIIQRQLLRSNHFLNLDDLRTAIRGLSVARYAPVRPFFICGNDDTNSDCGSLKAFMSVYSHKGGSKTSLPDTF